MDGREMTTAKLALFLGLILAMKMRFCRGNTDAWTPESTYETAATGNGTASTTTPWVDCYRLNCVCEHGKSGWSVKCSGSNIVSIPQLLPTDLIGLDLWQTRIESWTLTSFANYSNLRKLVISEDKALRYIEPLLFSYTPNLLTLQIYDCPLLSKVEEGVLYHFEKLSNLVIRNTGLTELPHLGVFQAEHGLSVMDFSNNLKIKTIKTGAFARVKTYDLKLRNTGIQTIENGAFNITDITRLNLSQNAELSTLGDYAFEGIKELNILDLSSTSITKLPTKGLDKLLELKLKDTKSLKQIPPVVKFLDLKIAEVTYPHHCCAFKNPEKQNPDAWREYQREQAKIQRDCASTMATTPALRTFAHQRYLTKRNLDEEAGFGPINEPSTFSSPPSAVKEGGGFGPNADTPRPTPSSSKNPVTGSKIFQKETIEIVTGVLGTAKCGQLIYRQFHVTNCTPEPNAWNPCEDVLGYVWLRAFIWIILMAAIMGNLAVITVILSGYNKMTVPKFLMCNLSFADFTMGVYLLLIASIDANTLGEYFNYAIPWQNEGGCQAAGFLSIFASELSIYTLTVITIERWYAISYAIHLNKRMRLKQAAVIMSVGWAFALIMSALPLSGVISSYATTSICLPFKFDSPLDHGYVLFLIIINGLAFLAVCGCYISMFIQVYRNSSSAPGSDATIAKRMAILVFTDFACYAPIAFFALTAAGGLVLINVTNSKVLLVFFYPLNSCANPFLYAIFTKQFRKDLFMMLSRYGFCHERAAKYKGTYASGGGSISHSRTSLPMHHVRHNASDGSILTQYVDVVARGSRPSIHTTPHATPETTPTQSQKNSSLRRSDIGRLSSGASRSFTPSQKKKLSVVHEKGPKTGSDNDKKDDTTRTESIETKYVEGCEFGGDDDIFDKENSIGSRVRSASQYEEGDDALSYVSDKKQDRHSSLNTELSFVSEDDSGVADDDKKIQNGDLILNGGLNNSADVKQSSIDRESGFLSSSETSSTNNNEGDCGKNAKKSSNRKKAEDIKMASLEELVTSFR